MRTPHSLTLFTLALLSACGQDAPAEQSPSQALDVEAEVSIDQEDDDAGVAREESAEPRPPFDGGGPGEDSALDSSAGPDTSAAIPLPLGPTGCESPPEPVELPGQHRVTPVVTFSELMYHPEGDEPEWIELRNLLSVDVDISGWRLAEGVRFTFPPGTILKGEKTLVVSQIPSALATAEGELFLGPFEGKLSNGGERVTLINNMGRLMDWLRYDDALPWPVAPDGSGVSLAKRAPTLVSAKPESWTRSATRGGTPGKDNFLLPNAAPALMSLVSEEAEWRYQLTGEAPAPGWKSPGFDASGWPLHMGLFALGESALATVEILATADNHFALYLGTRDAADLRLLGRDAEGTWTSPESFIADAAPGEHLFIAAWEALGDSGSPQMLIAEVTGVLATSAQTFEATLGPAGATPGGGLNAAAPDLAQIAAHTLLSDDAQAWQAPGAEVALGGGPWGNQLTALFPSAAYIWFDTFDPNSMSNQEETYALFRSVVPLIEPIDLSPDAPPSGVAHFRTTFTLSDPETLSTLKLTGRVDSGALITLNGVEIARVGMPEGPVDATTYAVAPGVQTLNLTGLSTAPLYPGENVLALSLHQASSEDTSLLVELSLEATLTPPGQAPAPSIVISEVSAGGTSPAWVELFNTGEEALDLDGLTLGLAKGVDHPLPDVSLAPGAYLVIGDAEPALELESEDVIVLRGNEGAVLDCQKVSSVLRGRDADGAWGYPELGTPGQPNSFAPRPTLAINEVMYHAPASIGDDAQWVANEGEWLELINTGEAALNLSDFSLSGGITFTFPEVSLEPGELILISDSGERPPGTPEDVSVLGPWSGRLSNSGDVLALRDGCGNPIERLAYGDAKPWPGGADGGGASLERRHPGGPSMSPESWGESEEHAEVLWEEVTYRAVATPSSVGPDGQWHELVLGLLDSGEVLLDDVQVIEDPDGVAIPLIQDPGFDVPDAPSWRFIGTHRHSQVIEDPEDPSERVLRLVAKGPAGHMHNHLETTLAQGAQINNGTEYEISYRARWRRGSNQLNSRLYFNRLARTTRLKRSAHPGTPGALNSTSVEALGPALKDLRHDPVVPPPGAPVSVSIKALAPGLIEDIALWTSTDNGPFESYPMVLNEEARFEATLPGLPLGASVQLLVLAEDTSGALSTFPARGEQARALYQVSAPLEDTQGKRALRIWMTPEDSAWFHATPNLMSNDKVGATVIYDEREIFYDVGVRAKGSQRGRVTDQRLGFALTFNADAPLLGAYRSAMIDRSQGVGFGQREWLLNQAMARSGSVSTEYNDLIHLVAPREAQLGPAELQLARFGNTMLSNQFDEGDDGQLFEYELIYYPTTSDDGSAEGQKLPQPDLVLGTNLGAPWSDKEDYRYLYLAKNNRSQDLYQGLIDALGLFDLPDLDFFEAVEDALDVDQWLRAFAFASLAGVTDQLASGNAHNAQLYLRPSDGRLLYFPHDLDFFFGAPTQGLIKNALLSRLITDPRYKRRFCAFVKELVDTSYNADYMAHWATLAQSMLPNQAIDAYVDFLAARAQHVMFDAGDAVTKLIPEVPFTLTSGPETELEVLGLSLTLEGKGWVNVRSIVHQESEKPLEVLWLDATTWQVSLTLVPGPQAVTLEAQDHAGVTVATLPLTVTALP